MKRPAIAMVLTLAVWLTLSAGTSLVTTAQGPEPSAAAVIVAGDPRSDGEGPGIVGSPALIAVGVVVLGLVAMAGTALVIRVTRR